MTLAVLLVWLWSSTSTYIAMVVSNAMRNLLVYEIPHFGMNHPFADFGIQIVQALIRVLPICWLAFIVAKGRFNTHSRLMVFFRSRSRLAVFALIWSLVNTGVIVLAMWHAPIPTVAPGQAIAAKPAMFFSYPIWPNVIYNISLPIAFIALLVWLMPPQFQAKQKAA